MATTDQVVVRFRFRGGEYCLEVDPSTAARLADDEGSFPLEADDRHRLRDVLLRTHRPSRA